MHATACYGLVLLHTHPKSTVCEREFSYSSKPEEEEEEAEEEESSQTTYSTYRL